MVDSPEPQESQNVQPVARPEIASLPPEVKALFARIEREGPPPASGSSGLLGGALLYVKQISRRRAFLKAFGWTVPSAVAVRAVAEFVGSKKVLEVGAGHGLWAYLLNAFGVDIVATDDYAWTAPPDQAARASRLPSGFSVDMGRFSPVENIDAADAALKYRDREVLLLSWPPPEHPMAYRAIMTFAGDSIIYIGDPAATGDAAFRQVLQMRWTLSKVVPVPTWPGLHDAIFLYERKAAETWAPSTGPRRENPSRF